MQSAPHTVHILFVCEKKDALATFISIFSLKQSFNSAHMHHVHILSVGLTLEQECALQALAESQLLVSVHSVDSQKEDTTPQDIVGILTLQLANIFWDLDKALYLDPYVLVQQDVHSFFTLDISSVHAGFICDATDARMHVGKVMLLHLQAMREDNAVAALMACNVPKGDYAGYAKALEKVLGEKSIALPQGYVACLPLAGQVACAQNMASAHFVLCEQEHTQENVANMWQDYAAKARTTYAAMYAAFV